MAWNAASGSAELLALGHVLHRLGEQELEPARHLRRAHQRPAGPHRLRTEPAAQRRRRHDRRAGPGQVSRGSRARLPSASVLAAPPATSAIIGAPARVGHHHHVLGARPPGHAGRAAAQREAAPLPGQA